MEGKTRLSRLKQLIDDVHESVVLLSSLLDSTEFMLFRLGLFVAALYAISRFLPWLLGR